MRTSNAAPECLVSNPKRRWLKQNYTGYKSMGWVGGERQSSKKASYSLSADTAEVTQNIV